MGPRKALCRRTSPFCFKYDPMSLTFRAKHEGRIGSDSAIEDERRTRRLAMHITGDGNGRRSSLIETNM